MQATVKKEYSTSCMVKHFGNFAQDTNPAANRNFKEIEINGIKFPAIIDTGSDISIIRFDVFEHLSNLNFIEGRKRFITAGNFKLITIGYFETVVSMDGVDINVKFFVAKHFVYPAAIGNDILKQVDIKITSDGATLVAKLKQIDNDVNINDPGELEEFCSTLLLENGDKYDISHLRGETFIKTKELLDGYCPTGQDPSPIKMKIILSDEIPIYQRPRRLSYEDQNIVAQQIKEWLRDGIIRTSTSEYASPIVLVSKKDGSKRLCCDFRKLNEKILRDNFPMMLIDDA